MKWIAAAGVALFGWLGLAGITFGAELVRVTPEGFFHSNLSYMASPEGDERIFLAERGNGDTGRASIRILDEGKPATTPFLTIDNVDVRGERGLMSLAFSPDYDETGLLYVFWIADGADALDSAGQAGDIRIVEYRRSVADPNRVDPRSARLVLRVRHSATNHNGGWMEFGPDGHLYLTIGDNADRQNAQALDNLYGKVMRIDPADPPGAATYRIPADNPFLSTAGARGEIWAYGLRNPYRASFAPDGRLTIGDVGEGTREEINAGNFRAENLGWPACEGLCSPPDPAFTDPVFDFRHDGSDGYGGGCAVVGGHVVEDPSLTGLTGRYIYADYCGGVIHSLDLDGPDGDFRSTGLSGPGNPVAFGTDSGGCSYMLQSGGVDGNALFRIVADETGTVACPHQVEPPPLPDVTYASFIPKRAVLAKRLRVRAKCSIACSATATGKIRISRNRYRSRPAVIKLKAASRELGAKVRRKLVLRVPARRVPKIKRAIRNGSKVRARITVRMVGEDSSGGSSQSKIRLVRPKRR